MIKPADKEAFKRLLEDNTSMWFVYYLFWYEHMDGDWRAYEIQERSRYPRGHNITRQLKRAREYWAMLDKLEWTK